MNWSPVACFSVRALICSSTSGMEHLFTWALHTSSTPDLLCQSQESPSEKGLESTVGWNHIDMSKARKEITTHKARSTVSSQPAKGTLAKLGSMETIAKDSSTAGSVSNVKTQGILVHVFCARGN